MHEAVHARIHRAGIPSNGDFHQFGASGRLSSCHVVVDGFEVQLDGFADVCQRAVARVTLADAAGQAR